MFCTDGWAMARQVPLFLMRCFSRGRSVTFLHHREALGDTLMLSAMARNLKRLRPEVHVGIVSRRPELFEGNPNVDENRGWHLWRSGCTVGAKYGAKDLGGSLHAVEVQWRSLWRELAAAKFPGANDGETPPIADVYPELFLTEAEIAAGRARLGLDAPGARPAVLIGAGGKLKPTHNREWGAVNYQALIDALAPDVELFQISGDERFSSSRGMLPDLRAISVREAAAIFSCCAAMLVQEGGLMHVARAVNAPCVSIFGGFVLPHQTGYQEQVNFFSQPACSPCIPVLRNCFHLKCMVPVTPRRVLEALAEKIRARSGVEIPRATVEQVRDEWMPPAFVDRDLLARELALDARTA